MNKVKVKWYKMPLSPNIMGTMSGGNYILESDDIFISYQPWKDINARDDVFETLNTMLTGDDTISDETALKYTKNGRDVWCILKGDFRKDYEKLFPDKKKCIAFYNKMKPKYGFDKWSTD